MNDDAHEVEGEAIDAEILAATEADMLAGRETSERAEAAWARRTAFIGRRAAEILRRSAASILKAARKLERAADRTALRVPGPRPRG